jgi:uncharacterized membrane protein
MTPTYVIGVVFLLVAVLFVMAAQLDWYGAFKTIHVVFAVIWIGGGFLISTLAFIAELERDVEGRTILAKQAASVSQRVFTPSSLIVLVFGIAMMFNDYGKLVFDWSDFWVIFGLLGFAATFSIGFFVLGPAAKRIRELVATVGPNAPEVHAEMNRIFLVARADAAILMLVVVDMTAKPFL